ncbi:MAG: hypothetical protein WBA35_00765, partial [Litorimonas sp.]
MNFFSYPELRNLYDYVDVAATFMAEVATSSFDPDMVILLSVVMNTVIGNHPYAVAPEPIEEISAFKLVEGDNIREGLLDNINLIEKITRSLNPRFIFPYIKDGPRFEDVNEIWRSSFITDPSISTPYKTFVITAISTFIENVEGLLRNDTVQPYIDDNTLISRVNMETPGDSTLDDLDDLCHPEIISDYGSTSDFTYIFSLSYIPIFAANDIGEVIINYINGDPSLSGLETDIINAQSSLISSLYSDVCNVEVIEKAFTLAATSDTPYAALTKGNKMKRVFDTYDAVINAYPFANPVDKTSIEDRINLFRLPIDDIIDHATYVSQSYNTDPSIVINTPSNPHIDVLSSFWTYIEENTATLYNNLYRDEILDPVDTLEHGGQRMRDIINDMSIFLSFDFWEDSFPSFDKSPYINTLEDQLQTFDDYSDLTNIYKFIFDEQELFFGPEDDIIAAIEDALETYTYPPPLPGPIPYPTDTPTVIDYINVMYVFCDSKPLWDQFIGEVKVERRDLVSTDDVNEFLLDIIYNRSIYGDGTVEDRKILITERKENLEMLSDQTLVSGIAPLTWKPSLGYNIIKEITFMIGNTVIVTHHG